MSEHVGVLGAGAFGTSLAKLLAEGGHRVRVYARDKDVADAITKEHRHPKRLAGVRLPPGLVALTDPREVVHGASLVVSAIPTQAVRDVWAKVGDVLRPDAHVMSATKGIENGTLMLVSDILKESVPAASRGNLCFLSGPSFALELCRRQPTAVTIAAEDEAVANRVQEIISTDYFRAYSTTDVVGVELGGALKNVVAIAAGAADGLGFGNNTRAAIITRGLAEMTRLAVKLGARPLTMAGLAGLGDLVLTCTGALSRNRTVGFELGQGKKLDQILKDLGQVAEGVPTARSVFDLSKREGVDMPISQTIYRVLFEGLETRDAVYGLMGRKLKSED
jgi:glycerol-3-phosphate dehydrogenase (NAD(P)+)